MVPNDLSSVSSKIQRGDAIVKADFIGRKIQKIYSA